MSKAYMVVEGRNFHQEMLTLGHDHTGRIRASSSRTRPRKVRIREYKIPDLNEDPCLDMDEEEETGEVVVVGFKPQDADYSQNVPQLPYEVEVEILARLPRFEYWKLKFLNKRFSRLLKDGKIFKVRRDRGVVEPFVFMRSTGEKTWTMFDKDFENHKNVPELPVPSDSCFFGGDIESLCAGTHMIVTGNEGNSIALWRYELETSTWFKGPAMITPRILFASATCGNVAYVAGGLIKIGGDMSTEVVDRAEKYDSVTKTWTRLRGMHKRRQFCSGCFLRGKFYVLGGKDENDNNLTCGERYDEGTDTWELIPDIYKDMSFSSIQSPPLIAVVNDNLYSLETSGNELRVYDTNANVWKKLGDVPVRAKSNGGWGVAFKSLGDKLLVIGESVGPSRTETMSVYTCRPSANPEEKLVWEESKRCCDVQLSHFILNCSVMIA